MLSENQRLVSDLIENKLSGNPKEEVRLYHYSVERKLNAVGLFFQNVLRNSAFIGGTMTSSASSSSPSTTPESEVPLDLESTINITSAYIDAFFMSGISALDAFAHEVRSLYGLGGHAGNLYFDTVLNLLPTHHQHSQLNLYLTATNVRNADWYQELKVYRRASAHESIIPIRPSIDLDTLTGQWSDPVLKLPLDPTQKPLRYNGKNFKATGKLIKDELLRFIITCYDNILGDILATQTIISP